MKDLYQVTIQRSQGEIPGYVQVDRIRAGVNVESGNADTFRSRGVPIPPIPADLPTGRYRISWAARFMPISSSV